MLALSAPYAWLDAPGKAVSQKRLFWERTQKSGVAGKRYPCLGSLILKEANQMETETTWDGSRWWFPFPASTVSFTNIETSS